MSLLVFITENCKADAQRHSLLDELERFKRRIEVTYLDILRLGLSRDLKFLK